MSATTDEPGHHPRRFQCPVCGHFVDGYFDHIAIDCEHDMTGAEIAALLAEDGVGPEPGA